MKFKSTDMEQEWHEIKAKNQTDYGQPIARFVERWANDMEALSPNKFDETVASETEFKSDTENLSGFGFSCAVGALVKVWIYGNELKAWYLSK
jgi:hypothetical protein